MTSSPADRSVVRLLASLLPVAAVIVWGAAPAAAQALPDFGAPLNYPHLAGVRSSAVATGDVNGDGRADLVVGQEVGVKVGLGDGSGAMTLAGTVGTGAVPNAIALVHLNSDTHLDMVTSNSGGTGTTFSVLFGDGSGAFPVETTYTVPANYTIKTVATGDATGDGRADVVVLSGRGCGANSFGCSLVTVWRNDGSGGLTADFSRSYAAPTGYTYSSYSAVRVADVNQDTRNDLVITVDTYDFGTEPQLQIMRGSGNGTFETTRYYYFPLVNGNRPYHTNHVEVADVNNDSWLDIVAMAQRGGGAFSNSHLIVLRNDKTGHFVQASGSAHNLHYIYGSSVQIGDLNDDGHPDLVGTLSQGSFGYFLNDGSGNFPTGTHNWSVGGVNAAVLADLNGSRRTLELVIVRDKAAFTLLNGEGAPTGPTSCPAGSYLSDNACVLAPAGSYSAGDTATSATPCPIGTYSSDAGAAACTPAGAGTYVSSTGATSATACAAGSYSDAEGASACTLAPAGFYVPTPGATSATACTVGYYSNTAGSTLCTPAPAGWYVATTGATAATSCPAGTYSDIAGASACTPAPAGSYVPNPGATSATPCPPHYSSNAGATACYPLDTDHDGVLDKDDAYINSNLSAGVSVGACAAGVPNKVLPNGASFNDLLASAVSGAANHGARVSAVSALANGWKGLSLISGRDHGAIVSCVARSK